MLTIFEYKSIVGSARIRIRNNGESSVNKYQSFFVKSNPHNRVKSNTCRTQVPKTTASASSALSSFCQFRLQLYNFLYFVLKKCDDVTKIRFPKNPRLKIFPQKCQVIQPAPALCGELFHYVTFCREEQRSTIAGDVSFRCQNRTSLVH